MPPTRRPPSAQAPRFIQLSPRSTNRAHRAIEVLAKLCLAGRRLPQCGMGARLRRAGGSGGTGAWGQIATQVDEPRRYRSRPARLLSAGVAVRMLRRKAARIAMNRASPRRRSESLGFGDPDSQRWFVVAQVCGVPPRRRRRAKPACLRANRGHRRNRERLGQERVGRDGRAQFRPIARPRRSRGGHGRHSRLAQTSGLRFFRS